jgi:hypothetical protein
MRNYACWIRWYTEVSDPDPENWTYTDGGSGEFPEAGFGNAAYFRRMFYTDPFGVAAWLLPNAAYLFEERDDNCYRTGPLTVSNYVGYEFENRVFCGGPGYDPVKAPYCH